MLFSLAIYDPNLGLLNSFLNLFKGAENPTLWLGDQKIVIYSIVIALVWQAIGYYMVMYMASMANVPESLYESAALEGAGKIRQFFTITIPLIWTNIRTTLTFFVISTINMSFLARNSNDEWWTGRSVQRIPELYVPGGLYELFIWIWYGDRCYQYSSSPLHLREF